MNDEFDFNVLETSASRHVSEASYDKALAIYFYMANGDASLDGGYLAFSIAECYKFRGDYISAKHWYLRAIEENPEIYGKYANTVAELHLSKIEDLLF